MPPTDNQTTLPIIAAEPVLGVVSSQLDAGDARQNHESAAKIPVANYGNGGQDLRVTLRSDVNWVSFHPTTLAIPAGEQRASTAVIAPTNQTHSGEQRITVAIESENAVLVHSAEIPLHVRVVEDVALRAEPDGIDLGQVAIGHDVPEQTLCFQRTDGRPARPVVVRFDAPDGLAQSLRAETDRDCVTIHIGTANRENGNHSGELVIADQDPDVSEVRIPIAFDAVDASRIECPDEVPLEVVKLSDTIEIPLTNPAAFPLKVSIETDAKWLAPAAGSEISIPSTSTVNVVFRYDIQRDRRETLAADVALRCSTDGRAMHRRTVRVVLRRKLPDITITAPERTRVVSGRARRVKFRIQNRGEGAAVVAPMRTPSWISFAEEEWAIPPGEKRDVVATVLREASAPAVLDGPIHFATNAPSNAQPEVAIYFHANVVDPPNPGRALRPLVKPALLLTIVALLVVGWLRWGTQLLPDVLNFGSAEARQVAADIEDAQVPDNAQPGEQAAVGNDSPGAAVSTTPPPKIQEWLSYALEHKRKGNYDKATAWFRYILQQGEYEDAVWGLAWIEAEYAARANAAGDATTAAEHYSEARTLFQRVTEIGADPKRVEDARGALKRMGFGAEGSG